MKGTSGPETGRAARRRKGVFPISLALLLLLNLTLRSFPAPYLQEGSSAEKDRSKAKKEKTSSLIVLPVFFYMPETKFGFGVGGVYYFRTSGNQPSLRPSTVLADVIYTQKKQFIVELFPEIYLSNDVYLLKGNFSLKKYPDKFFGIGNKTTKDQEENYTSRYEILEVSLQKRIISSLYAGLGYDFRHEKIITTDEAGMLRNGTLAGTRGGTTSGARAVCIWENRDSTIYPTTGNYGELVAQVYRKWLGSDYNFSGIRLDLRQYFPLSPSQVLAFQGFIKLNGGNIPFQMMALLGGEKQMRGYYSGRYRDKNMVVFQAEYRLHVWKRVGLVAFTGVGDVAEKPGRFKLSDFKYTFGWGVRFKLSPREGTNLRADFGYGKDTSGFYLTVNEAF